MNDDLPSPQCLLCGCELRSTIEDPANGERHEVLICGQHSDQELRDQGLDDLWGGVEPEHSPSFFEGTAGRCVVGAWEQGDGAYAVHILLGDGELISILSWGSSTVHAARLGRSQRLLERPVGVPTCRRVPWEQAVRERWQIHSLRPLPDGSVVARLIGRGTMLFKTYVATWREMGSLRHFLAEQWSPSRE